MMRKILAAAALMLSACSSAAAAPTWNVIPGSVPLDWRGPNGNSVILDAPQGVIVVDTGRHPEHAQSILDFATQRGRPIAAILNTHWHLDHTTGNWDIRKAYPRVQVYATTAIEGALVGFLNRNREQGDRMLADPKVPEGQKAQLRRARSVVDNPDRLRATRPVQQSGPVTIAGRRLELHVAPFAATEADLWIYDPEAHLAIVGDLVVDIVPFMDTACVEGWKKALDDVAATDFVTLIPGHGEPMDRAAFLAWRSAFNNFVACGQSNTEKAQCVAGWEHDAARFIPATHRDYVRSAAAYYIDSRLRSSPEEQQRYCKPLKA